MLIQAQCRPQTYFEDAKHAAELARDLFGPEEQDARL